MRVVNQLFILLLAAVFGASAARGADFDAANQLYDAGKFSAAADAYSIAVESGRWSANLFYNLGNAQFRLDQPGAAILSYQRALALEPSHPEAQANLALLRGRTGAVAWPSSWLDAIFPGRWISAYVVFAAVAGWLGVALLGWIVFTPPGDKAGRWFALVLAALAAGYAAVGVWHFEQARSTAIVVAKAGEVRLAPAATAAAGGVLPAGSEVRVLSVRGDWTYCALPDRKRGWIASRELQRVRIGDS